eukprot:SAG22_NODE_1036_length_5904_cov_4.908355_3_plen_158_part_00
MCVCVCVFVSVCAFEMASESGGNHHSDERGSTRTATLSSGGAESHREKSTSKSISSSTLNSIGSASRKVLSADRTRLICINFVFCVCVCVSGMPYILLISTRQAAALRTRRIFLSYRDPRCSPAGSSLLRPRTFLPSAAASALSGGNSFDFVCEAVI